MNGPTTIDAQLDTAAEALWVRRDELVRRQVEALADFAEYRGVPDDELARSCERNVARVVSMLRNEDTLPSDIDEDERISGARRARQGIPAEVVVAAYRAVIGEIRDAFMDQAPQSGASVDAVLAGIRRLWALTDHFSSTLVAVRHEAELDVAREDERRRITFVRTALDPETPETQVLRDGVPYEVSANDVYWLVRARVDPESVVGAHRALASSGGTRLFQPVLARHGDGGIEGVLGRRPTLPEGLTGLVAVAGPVGVSGFREAARSTARTLEAGMRFGLTGVIDRPTLGLRLTISEDVELAQLLVERFVEPVRRGSTMATDVLLSVRAFLDHRRSLPEAAAALSVHVNTIRYRLEKFQELTGVDLRETEETVGVWWALQADLASVGSERPPVLDGSTIGGRELRDSRH